LSGVLEAFAAGHTGGFDEQYVAAYRSPRQTCRHAGHVGALREFIAVSIARFL
jgi:hypothetical protein